MQVSPGQVLWFHGEFVKKFLNKNGILHFALKVVYTFNVEREKYFFDEPRAKRAEIVGAKNFSPLHGGRRCVQTRYSANWYMKDAELGTSLVIHKCERFLIRLILKHL